MTLKHQIGTQGFFAFLAILAVSAVMADERAEAMFRELEERLLSEKSLHFKFTVTSEGPVRSSLQGQVRLRGSNRAEIDVAGTYQSEKVNIRFESDGKRMRWALGDQKFDLETPKGLNEAIVIGFTRLGLFHNLSLLLGGKPPDYGSDSMEDWVQVSDFLFAAPDPSSKVRSRSVRFRIAVEGKDSGQASYWISPLTRLPVERRQTAHYPEGDLKIVESYTFPD